MADDYYAEEESEYDYSFIEKILSLDPKTLLIILVIAIILVGGALIATGVISPPVEPGDESGISFTDQEGTTLKVRGSTTNADGEITTFSTNGDVAEISMNPEETRRITLQTKGISKGLQVGTVRILNSDGEVISTSSGNITYEDGQLIIIVDPNIDLDLSGDPFDYEGQTYDYIFQVTLDDANTPEEAIFEIPFSIMFAEFVGTGCIALNRSSISETTHYGMLELDAKLRILCNSEDDLIANIDWSSKNMGPVEVLFDKTYSNGTTLVSDDQIIEESPNQGEYKIKIFFVPSTAYAGDRAKFDIDLKYGNAEQTIKFDVAIENLEQCISITTPDSIITSESDEATILIDAKNCKSNKINFYLCDGDYGCSGGSSEGEISLNSGYFTLAGGKSKTITVKRGEIPGVYGVSVHANISGMEKVFIDEKEITILPTTEYVYPEKFVVSLLEVGTKDSVRVQNTLLAQDVEVDASICDLYDKSLGVTDNESWIYKMYMDPDYYAGEGMYVGGLTNTLTQLDKAMFSAKNLSYVENVLIKDAYLSVEENDKLLPKLIELGKPSVDAGDELASAVSDVIDLDEGGLAAQITLILSDLYSMQYTATKDCTTLQTLIANGESYTTNASITVETKCAGSTPSTVALDGPLMNAALVEAADLHCVSMVETVKNMYDAFNDLKTGYDILEQLTADLKTMEVESSQENILQSVELLESAQEESTNTFDYLVLALDAAAIDSLESASNDDLDAKNYLELAIESNKKVSEKIDEAHQYSLDAADDLTESIPDAMEQWEEVNSYISSVEGLIETMAVVFITLETTKQSLELANTSFEKVDAAVASGLSTCSSDCAGTVGNVVSLSCLTAIDCSCVQAANYTAVKAQGVALRTEIISAKTIQYSKSKIQLGKMATYLGTALDSLTLYNSFANSNIPSAYSNTMGAFQEQLDKTDEMILKLYTANLDLENAILSAQKLVTYEKESSDASTYLYDNYVSGTFKQKKRMQGLVGSIVSAGFVNGAKEGGVYSTNDTLDAVDCENRVTMTLPDYQINLLTDAGKVGVLNNDIIAQWDFSEPKVYDLFEEQEVAISFSDNGLSENSYAIVEIPVKKHSHSAVTLVSGDFGPFNIPDSKVENLTYKYHFKFNMEERKAANPTKSAVCEKGILFGETGEDAGAGTILSWDWNAINSESVKGKYIDATQLSILISKKLLVIDHFLKGVTVSCPDNYATNALTGVVPADILITPPLNCHLPLSTKYYEGKPSLYHQLNYTTTSGDYPPGYDSFFDEPIINDAEQLLEVVDFEVNLMLDGYGTNFQDDFTTAYSRTLFKSNAGFTDPNSGAYKYFDNDKIFFYSSKAHSYSKDAQFVIPDAGKYRVRLLIDFDGDSPQLFSGGTTKAKVIVDLELIEPIKEDFSPLYYTPFDGFVGLNIKNNRKYYGTALSSGSELDIVKKEGIFLTTDQKDALATLDTTKLQSFVWMNALTSRRAKLLDYSYSTLGDSEIIFSPSTATPVLMKINGAQGTTPYLTYEISKNNDMLSARSNNLFLWSGLDGCKDFYGGKLNELVNNTPDYRVEDIYGMFFANPEESGAVYLKTMAYAPIEDAYGISSSGNGEIITTNYQVPTEGITQLDGISGMPYNDLPSNAKIDSLLDLFNAVDDGAVCVSQLGNREIYWWPEEYLFEKDNVDGENMRDKELAAKVNCIR